MPSPFPGMNPWLERAVVWPSFHANFLTAALFQLVPRVRPEYVVTVGTRMYIHEPPAEERRLVGLTDVGFYEPSTPAVGAALATAAPAYGTLPGGVQVERARFLEIRDKDGFGLVTVVELLSPSNKYAGDDHEQYLRKRWEVLRSRTHLVEIDLLRGGGRMPLDGLPDCDYCALVSRAEERPRVGMWPWRLRDPVPSVPIPLHAGDPDAMLDIKAVIDQVYDGGGYGNYIYSGPPEPRLAPDDAAWAAAFLPATA
jgi:hypothetical protein